jgi:hypothetical protein
MLAAQEHMYRFAFFFAFVSRVYITAGAVKTKTKSKVIKAAGYSIGTFCIIQ